MDFFTNIFECFGGKMWKKRMQFGKIPIFLCRNSSLGIWQKSKYRLLKSLLLKMIYLCIFIKQITCLDWLYEWYYFSFFTLMRVICKTTLPRIYRTRANNERSQLVAAPLSSQAKMHFLLAFYVTIWGPKTYFFIISRVYYWRGYGIQFLKC